MPRELTFKQESFCKAVALEGKNYSDAYRSSHNAKNMSDEAINVEASKLAKNPKVALGIRELKSKIEQKTIEEFSKSREQILNKLESLINNIEENHGLYKNEDGIYDGISRRDAVKEVRECLKEQAKLLGYYEDTHTLTLKGDKNNPVHVLTDIRIEEILSNQDKK